MIYNDKNEMIEYSDSDGIVRKNDYDANGRVEWTRNEKGEAMHYIYESPTSNEVARMELQSNKKILVYQANNVPGMYSVYIKTSDEGTFKELKEAFGMYAGIKIE